MWVGLIQPAESLNGTKVNLFWTGEKWCPWSVFGLELPIFLTTGSSFKRELAWMDRRWYLMIFKGISSTSNRQGNPQADRVPRWIWRTVKFTWSKRIINKHTNTYLHFISICVYYNHEFTLRTLIPITLHSVHPNFLPFYICNSFFQDEKFDSLYP